MTVIPSSGYVNHNKLPLIHEEYTDDQLIRSFSKALGDKVQYVDSAEPFFEIGDKGQLYYRTDHHWTSKGAFKCYSLLGNALGYTPLKEESFTKETVTDFYGTSYAKAALWAIAPDVIELWHNKKQPEDSVTVEIRDGADVKTSHSYFFPDQLRNDDKYPAVGILSSAYYWAVRRSLSFCSLPLRSSPLHSSPRPWWPSATAEAI